jgi:hypothetical protein
MKIIHTQAKTSIPVKDLDFIYLLVYLFLWCQYLFYTMSEVVKTDKAQYY